MSAVRDWRRFLKFEIMIDFIINDTLVKTFPEWRDLIYKMWNRGDDFWEIFDFIFSKVGADNVDLTIKYI